MIIGLTGNIATGKSMASLFFKGKGAVVIDADLEAHKLYQTDHDLVNLINKQFNLKPLKNNELDRIALGKLVFKHKELLNELNEIVHPRLFKAICSRAEELSKENELVIIDAALIFEWKEIKYNLPLNYVLVVHSEDKYRLKRLVHDRKMLETHAQNRINSQMSSQKKLALADYVIYNNDSKTDFINNCNLAWKKIQNLMN